MSVWRVEVVVVRRRRKSCSIHYNRAWHRVCVRDPHVNQILQLLSLDRARRNEGRRGGILYKDEVSWTSGRSSWTTWEVRGRGVCLGEASAAVSLFTRINKRRERGGSLNKIGIHVLLNMSAFSFLFSKRAYFVWYAYKRNVPYYFFNHPLQFVCVPYTAYEKRLAMVSVSLDVSCRSETSWWIPSNVFKFHFASVLRISSDAFFKRDTYRFEMPHIHERRLLDTQSPIHAFCQRRSQPTFAQH